MTTNKPSLLDELEDRHRAILQELLVQKLTMIVGWTPTAPPGEDWELYHVLHELGLIADELRRMGPSPSTEDIPF